MKKYLSILLAALMVFSTVSFAVPQAYNPTTTAPAEEETAELAASTLAIDAAVDVSAYGKKVVEVDISDFASFGQHQDVTNCALDTTIVPNNIWVESANAPTLAPTGDYISVLGTGAIILKLRTNIWDSALKLAKDGDLTFKWDMRAAVGTINNDVQYNMVRTTQNNVSSAAETMITATSNENFIDDGEWHTYAVTCNASDANWVGAFCVYVNSTANIDFKNIELYYNGPEVNPTYGVKVVDVDFSEYDTFEQHQNIEEKSVLNKTLVPNETVVETRGGAILNDGYISTPAANGVSALKLRTNIWNTALKLAKDGELTFAFEMRAATDTIDNTTNYNMIRVTRNNAGPSAEDCVTASTNEAFIDDGQWHSYSVTVTADDDNWVGAFSVYVNSSANIDFRNIQLYYKPFPPKASAVSLRASGDTSGIRVHGEVATDNTAVEYGWIVTKNATVGASAAQFTHAYMDANSISYAKGYNMTDTVSLYEEDAGKHLFNAVLINIPKEAYQTDLYSRPYIKLADGTYIYGTAAVTNLDDVANNLKNDADAYASLTQAQKDVVDAIIAGDDFKTTAA